MKRLILKYLFSFIIVINLITLLFAAAGYLYFVSAVKRHFVTIVQPAIAMLPPALAQKNTHRIKNIVNAFLVRREIAMSAVLYGKEKTVLVRGPHQKEHITWPFNISYPVVKGGETIGTLKIWPCLGCVAGEMTTIAQLGTLSVLILLWWIAILAAAIVLFLRNILLPARKLDSFVSALARNGHSRLAMEGYSRDWRKLAENLNRFIDSFAENKETLRMLFSLSKSLTSAMDLGAVFNAMAENIQKRIPDVLVALVAPGDDGILRLRHHRGFSPDFSRAIQLRPGEGFAGQSFQKCETIVVNDSAKMHSPATRSSVETEGLASFVHIPLMVESRCVGILSVASREKGHFTPERVAMLSDFAEYLSIALRNAFLYERVQELNRRLETEVSITTRELIQTNTRLIQKVREMKALSDIAAYAAAKANLADILEMIVEKIKELLSAQSAGLLLYSPESGELIPSPPFFGIHDRDFSHLRFKVNDTDKLAAVLAEGKSYLANNVPQGENPLPLLAGLQNVHSLLLVPLRPGKKPIGLIAVANKFGTPFNQDDTRILELIADRVAGIIENVKLYQELEQRLHDLTTLQEISSSISSEPVWGRTLKKIVATATRAFNADLCALLFYDEKTMELVTQPGAYFTGGDEAVLLRIPVDDSNSLSAQVFRSGEPFLSPDASIDLRIKSQTARLWDVRSLILVPLKAENRVIGVLRIGKHQAGCYGNEHLRLAGLIAHQAAIIIENAHLYESLREAKVELEELNKIKNEFISTVSHELRTPITAVKGFLKVVLEGEAGGVNEQQRKFLMIADQSIDRLTVLVSDLLDISRIESGQLKLYLTPVDTKEIIDTVIKDLAPQMAGRRLQLEVRFPDKMPLVMADRERLIRVFDNLIVNSIKFTPDGGTITVSAQDKGDFVAFQVTDTGIGIDKKDQQRIFDKFFQVDSGSTRTKGGAGLGLAIVKSIVEIHGGQVWVESEPGQGASFYFVVPRAKMEIKDFRKEMEAHDGNALGSTPA